MGYLLHGSPVPYPAAVAVAASVLRQAGPTAAVAVGPVPDQEQVDNKHRVGPLGLHPEVDMPEEDHPEAV